MQSQIKDNLNKLDELILTYIIFKVIKKFSIIDPLYKFKYSWFVDFTNKFTNYCILVGPFSIFLFF